MKLTDTFDTPMSVIISTSKIERDAVVARCRTMMMFMLHVTLTLPPAELSFHCSSGRKGLLLVDIATVNLSPIPVHSLTSRLRYCNISALMGPTLDPDFPCSV